VAALQTNKQKTASTLAGLLVGVSAVGFFATIVHGGSNGMSLPPEVLLVFGLLAVPYIAICITRPLLAWALALSLTLVLPLQAQGAFATFGLADFAFVILAAIRVLTRLYRSQQSSPLSRNRDTLAGSRWVRVLFFLSGVLVLLALGSMVYAPAPELAAKEAGKWLEIIGVIWLTADILSDAFLLRRALTAYWTVWAVAVIGVLGPLAFTWFGGDVPYARAGGDAGSLAAIVAIAVLVSHRSLPARTVARVILVLGLVAIGASLTRQSLISVSLAGAVVMLIGFRTHGRKTRTMGVLVFTAVAGVAAFLILPDQVHEYFISRIVSVNTASDLSRISLLNAAIEMFRQNPLLGVGAGNFTPLVTAYPLAGLSEAQQASIGPHNWFMLFAAEDGILGLGIFVGIVTAVAYMAWSGYQASRGDEHRWVSLALVGVWVHWLVVFVFGDITGENRLILAATMGMIVAAYRLADMRAGAASSSERQLTGASVGG
jgi:O-antigen ligase